MPQETTLNKYGIEYYKKDYIKHLIRENVANREVSALGEGNIRGLRIKCIFDMDRILKLINWATKRQNLYRSVARVKDIPEFTFNPKTRSEETHQWFNEKFNNLMYEYDLFLDFDKTKEASFQDVLQEVKTLLEYFEDYKLPYYVLFSGKKGFQVIIDGKYMPKPEIKERVVQPHKKIVEQIKEVFNFKFLDLSNNGVPNRLCKIPYSLVGDNVALPLDPEQVQNFDENKMNVISVVQNIKPLMRRGLLERNSNLTQEEKIKNIKSFIKVMDFK